MKKFWVAAAMTAALVCLCGGQAGAVVNDTVKVGLRFGSSALYSANLENALGSGYAFGYFDTDRRFVELGRTTETTLSMTQDGDIHMDSSGAYSEGGGAVIGGWHAQLPGAFGSFEEARSKAAQYDGGFPAYVNGSFVVRLGSFPTEGAARSAASAYGGTAEGPSPTGITVTRTKTSTIVFQFDCMGARNLGILPLASAGETVTWFKGYKYRGGFEYQRVTGGPIQVVNVVGLEDYVQGVLPGEMGPSWPGEALKAQAVCARTYACRTTKHLSLYGFDVCNGVDCQVYTGVSAETAATNAAVEATAGLCLYADGELIEALYHSSNGGATEDAANVWGGETSYLKGKADPYEASISIPNYSYSVTYTAAELTYILQNKGYSIGTVTDAYVSGRTPAGNVAKVTFVDSAGRTVSVEKEACRTVFYSSTYGKSVKSMRFDIAGGSGGSGGGGYAVNGASGTLPSLSGASVISGDGTVSACGGDAYVITSSGKSPLAPAAAPSSGGGKGTGGPFTITGTGSGHNVGLSQYGASAMAQQGCGFEEILNFYYTGVTIG